MQFLKIYLAMTKRQSDQPCSSKHPRIEEDDDLSDHDIEIDHMPTLSIRQREFADQFLNDQLHNLEQTLPEDYVEPNIMLEWSLERIANEEKEEQEEEEEDLEQEQEQEEENEERNNLDGEISQSTQDILEIVYGEHVIDPYAEYTIKPNSKFPDWVNSLIKARHGEILLIKEEFFKGYENERHTAFGNKWPGLKKYTIIIDNGSTRKRSFEESSMLIKSITIDQIYQFFNQLIGLVDYIVCRCDKTERGCVEYQHYHCILISSKEYQPHRFRVAFNKYFGCTEEYIKKNVRRFFYRKMAFAIVCGNMSPWCGMTNYIAVGALARPDYASGSNNELNPLCKKDIMCYKKDNDSLYSCIFYDHPDWYIAFKLA